MERYVIRGGKRGYERLQLLARERWPSTAAFLARVGLQRGMQVADLGCGGGQVTMEIARMVDPAQVVGFDMDEVKLALAREEAARRGIANVVFRVMNVHDWHEPAAYDAVYTRFLLQHLRDPIEIARRMWEAVRPGGVMLVEDADFDGWACHPENAGFEFFKRSYAEVLRRSGGDHAMGRKLLALFLEAGIPRPDVSVVQPLALEGEAKTLPWTTLDASADQIVAKSVATREEVDAALSDMEKLIQSPTALITGPRVFQAWSRRPG